MLRVSKSSLEIPLKPFNNNCGLTNAAHTDDGMPNGATASGIQIIIATVSGI